MKIRFLGATQQVTGSSYLLEDSRIKILVDCGMFQEPNFLGRNWNSFPVPAAQIQYVLLTHVHQDHSGLIPKLVKEGFKGQILLTPASKELFPIVILDSARIQTEDTDFKKRHNEIEGQKELQPESPLYTIQDAEKSFTLLKAIPYEQFFTLNDQVKVVFHDAGHILGSAMIEVVFQDENESKKIIFSGDIGQWDKPLLNNPSIFERADYVIMESTYGDHNNDSPQDIDEKFSKVINDTIKANGNIIIPTFAIERAQELLYHFSLLVRSKRIPDITIFLDSPMAVEVTKVYKQNRNYFDKEATELIKNNQSPFDFPGLKLVESIEGSKAINLIKDSIVIMAGSGMISGGRIMHHLVREISRKESTLLFVGYQAVGTLGRQILDGVSPVEILGQYYPVQLRIENFESLSAHADMDDLHSWLNNFKSPPKHLFLTHGEEEPIKNLENYVRSKLGWKVTAPKYLEEFEL